MTKNVQIAMFHILWLLRKNYKEITFFIKDNRGWLLPENLKQECKFSNTSSNILDVTEFGYHRLQQVEPLKTI